MLYPKKLIKPPLLFVFLSFLFGLSNFIDTSLRLSPFPYPPEIILKPLFFVLQAFCLIGFLFHMMSYNKPEFRNILNLHLFVLTTTIVLFFVYEAINLGKYGITILFINHSIWFICYLAGLSVTCFWFFSKLLKETRFRKLSVVFLFVGLAFFTNFLNEIYLWPQTLFDYPLPPEIERITMIAPALFMGHALFYTWGRLAIRKKSTKKNVAVSPALIFKLFVLIIALLLPLIWNNYREGLINMIIRAIIEGGLGYPRGSGWLSVSLYLVAFVTYVFLIKHLKKRLDQTIPSYLILLGVVSLPWNGLMVLHIGYSSIPGNILSIDALIVGFFLRKHRSERKPQ